MAENALQALNGSQVLPGTNAIRVAYYQRANKFLGGMAGLSRDQLIKNTHWRVLFIKGINPSVPREALQTICEKYGHVETIALKTRVEANRVLSRGLAVVQYATKEAAAAALKRLPFETSLGQMLEIDFY